MTSLSRLEPLQITRTSTDVLDPGTTFVLHACILDEAENIGVLIPGNYRSRWRLVARGLVRSQGDVNRFAVAERDQGERVGVSGDRVVTSEPDVAASSRLPGLRGLQTVDIAIFTAIITAIPMPMINETRWTGHPFVGRIIVARVAPTMML